MGSFYNRLVSGYLFIAERGLEIVRRTTKALAALAASALLLSACGQPSEQEGVTGDGGGAGGPKDVTLRVAWWGGQPRHDYTLKVIEKYEELNPHVTIEPEYAAFDDYWKKLSPQAAANRLPDVFQMDISYISQYGSKGQLEDLTPYLDVQIKVDDIDENVLNSGKIGDSLYGITAGVNALGFHYDPALLKKAGIDSFPEQYDWDDYVEMAMKAKDAGLYFDTGMRAEIFFGYFLRQHGETLYNAEGNALGYEDDALFVEYFGRLAELVKAKAVPTPDMLAQVKGPEDDPVVKEQAVGIWQWSNQFVALQQIANRPLEIGRMMGPDMEKGLYLQPSMFWSISKNSKVKEEAAKFIDFLTNSLDAHKLILGERGVPISAAVKEGIKADLTPAQQQVFEYVAWAEKNSSPIDPPAPVGAAEVMAALKNYNEQLQFGQITAEEAAKRFREEASAVLGKNK